MKTNDRGFAVVTLLLLLPLLVSAFMVLSGIYFVLRADGVAKHQCRVELLRAQNEINQVLKDLIDLNPQAKKLRAEARHAKKARVLRPVPVLGKAVMVWDTTIKVRQTVLAAKQMALIAKGKLKSRLEPIKVSNSVVTRLRPLQRGSIHSGIQKNFSSALFDVVAEPKNSVTPDYKPAPNFSRTQEMSVSWKVDARSVMPAWLAKLLPDQPLDLKGSCRATLEKENRKWKSNLIEAKSLWNSSFQSLF